MKDRGRASIVNRRYLRIKVFQGLYAYHRTPNPDLAKHQTEILKSIDKLYDLYLYLIALIIQVKKASEEMIEANRKKNLPTREDLHPNLRFLQNRVFALLEQNDELNQLLEKRNISWSEEHDDIRKIFKNFREDEAFQLYMIREDSNFKLDKELILFLFKEFLCLNEIILAAIEEKNIYWQDDLPMAAISLIKTIESLPESASENDSILADLYKEKEEDQVFVKALFQKTIEFDAEYSALIAEKAQNWESDRIAMLDLLLMQMALVELEHFPTVPVKVTLNEYIELAKVYSTPKSKVFINGVLDKLVADMKLNKRINKEGRGLVE